MNSTESPNRAAVDGARLVPVVSDSPIVLRPRAIAAGVALVAVLVGGSVATAIYSVVLVGQVKSGAEEEAERAREARCVLLGQVPPDSGGPVDQLRIRERCAAPAPSPAPSR